VIAEDPAEMPPLSPEGLEELADRLNRAPNETVARFREIWDKRVTEDYLREVIDRARRAVRSPETAIAALETARAHAAVASTLPPDFTFDGMDIAEIPIDPGDTKFETVADALGWIFGAGPFALTQPDKDDFRRHSTSASGFIYDLEEPTPGSPMEVALFSDFGTGRYHSRYIAKQFRTRGFPYAIHVGDVYYAGRRSEFEEYFIEPLAPILAGTGVFALNSNHEMYSGGIPYFEYIDQRAQSHPDTQKQQGSYFCLRNSKFQIVGIDTAFFEHGRYKEPELLEWLSTVLKDGKDAGCVNILLSADQPYEYGDLKLTKLLRKDLAEIVLNNQTPLVDLWFWGNTHYCALFDRGVANPNRPALPFTGSCIGHGGYPYDRERTGKNMPAPLVFLETRARFPEGTGLRQDRGNNGYCILTLKADGSLELRYIDWMGNMRCEVIFSRGTAADPAKIIAVNPGA